MGKSREIHAIDYAIIEFVCALSHIFRLAINPIELKIAGGLKVEVVERSPIETFVRVRPACWPDTSQISIRFQKSYREGEGSWKAFEGMLIARHLPREFSEFAFECDWCMEGYYRFHGKYEGDEKTLGRLQTTQATEV